VVPWSYIAEKAQTEDISAPGLLSIVLPSALGLAILGGATIALINDLPAMLLSVSRLMFAWAKDGIFPSYMTAIHPRTHTPYRALIAAGAMASVGVLGSHLAGDFFLGIDIMVTAMMVNFLLMCITLLTLPRANAALSREISVVRNPFMQKGIGILGILFLLLFLGVHTYKDLTATVAQWYFHSTPVYLLVMGLASLLFLYKWKAMEQKGTDPKAIFKNLPEA
jgi:basic amino acid/polyamine antiporter, APA family